MTETNPTVEATRNAIVEMLHRRQQMKAARLVQQMDLTDATFDQAMVRFADAANPQPVTYGDHIAVLNCPDLHSAHQIAEAERIVHRRA